MSSLTTNGVGVTEASPTPTMHEHTPMDPDSINTASLAALQNADQRKVMDVVDKLRRGGLSSVLQLPQLVVCGDQSSGKSSVLEAITEIPFPRKENLCTRFATEIVLRNSPTSSITTKITPDKSRSPVERTKLEDFSKSIQHFNELPSLIEEATQVMGLDDAKGTHRAFSRDVLSVEISGPQRPQLTLVDLPGLIHAGNKQQSKQDVELIRELVGEYISNERSIILCVVSAKNDYANQIILERARQVDKTGSRTLGVITKPDFLRPGSENEQTWIDLAMNRDIVFELGWHMLKNRGEDEIFSSFEERNSSESRFFAKGRYCELPQDIVGIESLRSRLSRLLNNHLRKELPDLKKELDSKLKESAIELAKLGQKRSTAMEQRQFLMGISMNVHGILKAAANGIYEDPFFGKPDLESAVDFGRNLRRLGAVVENLNLEFSKTIRTNGSRWIISKDPSSASDGDSDDDGNPRRVDNTATYKSEELVSRDAEVSEEEEGYSSEASSNSGIETQNVHTPPKKTSTEVQTQGHSPRRRSRESAIDWVLGILQRCRGRELPGNYNPTLIGHIFREQSSPWEKIARDHTEAVAAACECFVRTVFASVAPSEIQARLYSLRIEAQFEKALRAAHAELSRIIADKNRHPSTYDHYYTTTIQKMRQEKYEKRIRNLSDKCSVEVDVYIPAGHKRVDRKYIDPQKFASSLQSSMVQDMDRFSAEEALDSQMAYYKGARKYFVDVVTKQVIERHLVAPLADNIFHPNSVLDLTDDEVEYVAGEQLEVTQRRVALEGRKKMLKTGQATFRKAMGALR